MAVFSSFDVAENTVGSCWTMALLRWVLVLVFLWFGGMKFTSYEAHGIESLIVHSPIMNWMIVGFGIRGASDVIGVLELSTAAALITGALDPIASALGAAMSTATYLVTVSFFLSTPGVAEPAAGGFPAISAPVGQFPLKDVVLLAASLTLLLEPCCSSRCTPKRPSRPPSSPISRCTLSGRQSAG